MPSSRGSFRLRDQTCVSDVSCTGRQVLYCLSHQESPRICMDRLSLLQGIFLTQESNWVLLHCRKIHLFPGGASAKEPACQCRKGKRRRFDSWVWKIPWRKKWQPTPVFMPRESPWTEEPGGLQSMGSQRVGHDRSDLAHTRAHTHTLLKNPEWTLLN